jgi:hypothetical protein
MPRRHLRRLDRQDLKWLRQDLKWLVVVLSLLIILAVLLAFGMLALGRLIHWFLRHSYCFDYCPDT